MMAVGEKEDDKSCQMLESIHFNYIYMKKK